MVKKTHLVLCETEKCRPNLKIYISLKKTCLIQCETRQHKAKPPPKTIDAKVPIPCRGRA
jgi:hypothetical protein